MAYSLTYYRGAETIVQFVPEPDSDAEGLVGTGRTRCAPTDAYQAEIGQRIAFGRALKDLGRHIESEGMSAVVSNKDVKRLLDKMIRESVRQAREENPEEFDAEVNAIAEEDMESEAHAASEDESEQPKQEVEDRIWPEVPDGIEKWMRDNGYRLERNDV